MSPLDTRSTSGLDWSQFGYCEPCNQTYFVADGHTCRRWWDALLTLLLLAASIGLVCYAGMQLIQAF